MKQLVIFLSEYDFDNIDIINKKLISKWNNSLIELNYFDKDQLCWEGIFHSKFDYDSKLKLNFNLFDFSNINSNKAKEMASSIVENSYFNSIELSNEAIEKNFPAIESIILNTLNTFCYLENEFSIFDFAAKIFFLILNEHRLKNGNKRMAYSVLSNLLYTFGFYFKYSKTDSSRISYSSLYESFIEEIKSFISSNETDEQVIERIKNFIENNIVIGLNFK